MTYTPAALDASGTSRPVRPPAAHCVASANGWIVAAVDCPTAAEGGSGGSSSSNHQPPLRMISRWNVRRGTTTATMAATASASASSSAAAAEFLVALPPPVLPSGGTGTGSGTHSADNATAIAHVFVDPTGCHVLASAQNGEAYYLHSTSQKAVKLAGFGPNPDGSPSCKRSTAGGATSVDGSGTTRQLGLTSGSYVTAVGWDRSHGTEGSSKKILLGTSMGEVYEFALNGADHGATTSSSSRSSGSGGSDEGMPVLLHRFDSGRSKEERSRGGGGGAAYTIVSGIHFERPSSSSMSYQDGPFVLAVTSGISKRTRLHTFHTNSQSYSSPTAPASGASASFATTFSSEGGRSSFIELPGSVAFADLLICGDDFSIKTETGLYYGNTHSAGSASIVRQLSAGGAAESGLLSYSDVEDKVGMGLPTATAMTPNHFILLCGPDDVRFVNRVALKAIQNERVNWISMAKMAGDEHIGPGAAELLMDSRRPDQVWLRKSRCLVHVSSSCETRDEWMYALQKCLDNSRLLSGSSPSSSPSYDQTDALFEHAASLCTNNLQKAVVAATRAEFHLLGGRIDVAAKLMADCPPQLLPFDKTSVLLGVQALEIKVPNEQFLSSNAQDALASSNIGLISYLSTKMRLAKVKDDSVSYTMIASWLASLHLDEITRKSTSSGIPNNRSGKMRLEHSTATTTFDKFYLPILGTSLQNRQHRQSSA